MDECGCGCCGRRGVPRKRRTLPSAQAAPAQRTRIQIKKRGAAAAHLRLMHAYGPSACLSRGSSRAATARASGRLTGVSSSMSANQRERGARARAARSAASALQLLLIHETARSAAGRQGKAKGRRHGLSSELAGCVSVLFAGLWESRQQPITEHIMVGAG